MEFTIYTLGDNAMFRSILTGVAMIFDPSNSDTWVSSGGVGIGAAAALGLMLTLILLLFMAIQSQKFEMGLMIVLVVAYAALFVPKFTVNLEDIYGGGVTKVDNIPLGIALPASMASSLAYELGGALETVFSTVDGNYLSLTKEGFLSPLKVLASLRNGWKQVYSRDPDLSASLVQYAQMCGSATVDQQAMNTSQDSIGYLLSNPPTDRSTQYYSKTTGSYPLGILVPCADAAARLLADTDSLVNDARTTTKVSDIVNGALDAGKGKDSKQGHTVNDIDNYLISVTGASVGDAKAFTAMTLLQPLVNAGLGCAAGQNMQYCLQYMPAEEMRKEDSAAGGNFFLRTMKNGSNMFSFVIYAFAPIVALLLVSSGGKGIKVAGSYLLLLIWVNSWMIFAAIINYYIQLQIKNEFFMAGGASVLLTPGGYLTFYDKLSQKIMLASDMMGMIPMLSLALLSGSMFALTKVAGSWGSEGIKPHYDEKVNSPQTLDAKAQWSRDGIGAVNAHTGSTFTGLADPTVSVGDTFRQAKQSAQEGAITAGHDITKASSDLLKHNISRAEQNLRGYSSGNTSRHFDSHQDQLVASNSKQVMDSNNLTESERAATEGIVAAGVTASYQVGGAAGTVVKQATGAGIQAQLNAQLRATKGISTERAKQLSESLTKSIMEQTSDAKGWENARVSDNRSVHSSTLDDQKSHDLTQKIDDARKRQESASQKYAVSAALEHNGAWSNNMTYNQLGASLNSPEAHSYLRNEVAKFGPLGDARRAAALADINKSRGGAMEDESKEAVANLLALRALDPAAAVHGMVLASPQAMGSDIGITPTSYAYLPTDPSAYMSNGEAGALGAQARAAGADAASSNAPPEPATTQHGRQPVAQGTPRTSAALKINLPGSNGGSVASADIDAIHNRNVRTGGHLLGSATTNFLTAGLPNTLGVGNFVQNMVDKTNSSGPSNAPEKPSMADKIPK